MQHIRSIGPIAALQLIGLHLEGKYRLTVKELELLESIVISTLTRLEAELKVEYGYQDWDDETEISKD